MEELSSSSPTTSELLTVHHAWHTSWRTWHEYAVRFGALMLLPYLLSLVLNLLGVRGPDPQWVLAIVIGLVTVVLTIVAYLALLLFLRDRGNNPTMRDMVRAAFALAPSYILTGIITALLIGAGFLLLIVPGVIAAVYFSMVPFVFVWEGRRGIAAVETSWWRVRGRWWRMVLHLLVLLAVVAIVPAIIEGIIAGVSGHPRTASEVMNAVTALILTPWSYTYLMVVYEGLRATSSELPPNVEVTRARRNRLLTLLAIAVVMLIIFVVWFLVIRP